ncbi:MAG: AraC family transcriptional regulator [Acidovorax sp.]|uniref:AraC family transcriptional regulator n=1 Tax=Acidovorax sp. TaxID=1872122 RepID=UPI0039E611B8
MAYRNPVDLEPRVYGPRSIAAVVVVMAQDGVEPEQVLAGSGLGAEALPLPDTRVSYAQMGQVFDNAARLARTPTAALRAGMQMRLTSYGMYSYALLSSASTAEVIDFAVRYHRSMGPLTDISFTREDGVDAFRHEPLLAHDPESATYRFMVEFALAAHQALCRDLYGDAFAFSAIRLAYPAPGHAQELRDWFQCPVQFDQPVNEVQIGGTWSQRAPRMPDPVTHATARSICQQFLADLPHSSGVAATVRRVLVTQQPWRFPRIELMADELAMHPRTLRRRLEAQGTSYRQILSEVRCMLAIDYLRKTRMTTEEIASRLGYSDASNFRHAFTRWTGKVPHDYRRAPGGGGA